MSASGRIAAAGYPVHATTGENIAWGEKLQGTPVETVDGWMHSPGHKANILRPQFTEIGVGIAPRGAEGYAHGEAATYTTDFGGPAEQSAPAAVYPPRW